MSHQTHRFEIRQRLGKGGFGEVYRAVVDGGPSEVAIKLLKVEDQKGSQGLERLNDEARYLSIIDHPGVVQVLGMVEHDGRPGLVTEHIPGRDLRRLLARCGPLPASCVAEVIADVCGALHAAHEAPTPNESGPLHLIHRDIKPANIMVEPSGRVVLLDFGVARTDVVEREADTRTGLVIGTGLYTAPETIGGEPPQSRSDVWGLALTAFRALSGEQLFETMDMAALIRLVQGGDPRAQIAERLSSAPMPAELLGLLVDMTELEPDTRPDTHEVEQRARSILDVTEGPRLAEWLLAQDLPPLKTRPSELDGAVLEAELLPIPAWPGVEGSELVPPASLASQSTTGPRPSTNERSPLIALAALLLCVIAAAFVAAAAIRPAEPEGINEDAVSAAEIAQEEEEEVPPHQEPAPEVEAALEPTEPPPSKAPQTAEKGPRPGPAPRSAPAAEKKSRPAAPNRADDEVKTRTVSFLSKRKLLVSVSGDVKGYTPLKVKLPIGSHSVTATVPGRPDTARTRQVDIPPGLGTRRVDLDR